LKSILAHEYGHLYNKDTAGGSFALFVRRSIQSATDIMETDLVNSWYNPIRKK
jgi:Zn-dependent protease with chaperone function